MTTFMLWQDVVNSRRVRHQLFIAVGAFPFPGFEDVLSEFSTGKFRSKNN